MMSIERAPGDVDSSEGYMIWHQACPAHVYKTAAEAHIQAAKQGVFMPPVIRRGDVAFSRDRGYYIPASSSVLFYVEQDAEAAKAVDSIWSHSS